MTDSAYEQEPSRKVDTTFLRERKLKEQYEREPNGGLTWEEYLYKMNEQDGFPNEPKQTASNPKSKKSWFNISNQTECFSFS